MRITSFEAPFDDRAIKAMLGRIRIDCASLEYAIRRTVESLACQPAPKVACQLQPQISQAPKRRAKAVAAIGSGNGHPGAVPASWDDATAEQLAWWRDRYSWHSTLFVSRLPSRSPAEMHDVIVCGEAWAKKADRRKAKVDAMSRTAPVLTAAQQAVVSRLFDPAYLAAKYHAVPFDRYGESGARFARIMAWRDAAYRRQPALPVDFDGCAYVLPAGQKDWSTTPNRHIISRVVETDPTHYGQTSRTILEMITNEKVTD